MINIYYYKALHLQHGYKLKQRINIVASGLLLLMVLSIMPKTFLHELFANHQDVEVCNDSKVQGPCIHKQGYSCQQSDLVVPSSYTCTDADLEKDFSFVIVEASACSSALLSNFHSSSSGRGPPNNV